MSGAEPNASLKRVWIQEPSGRPEAAPNDQRDHAKILLCTWLYYPHILGGVERSVQLIAESLVKAGHNVAVATLTADHDVHIGEVRGVRVYYLPLRNLYWPLAHSRPSLLRRAVWHGLDSYNPWMGAALTEVLDDERPDVVNTHAIAGFSVAIWRAVKVRGYALVHTLREQYLLCPRHMFKDGRNCPTRCLECVPYAWPRKWASTLVDVVTGVSRFILDKHLALGYFSDTPQVVVYNAYRPSGRGQRVTAPGAHPGPLRFGYLGRLDPAKGVDQLLRAFLSLEPGAAELWIAGSGRPEYERALMDLARGRTDVRWLGFVEPEELLDTIDVLAVPSLVDEAFGRTIVEGLAHGVPIVGSNRGAIPEILVEDGGWLFDPDGGGSLAQTLRYAIDQRDKLAAMGAAGQVYAQRFSPEAVTAKYLAAYDMALSVNRSRSHASAR